MQNITFGPDFVWGAATSSYQIEGAAFEDGKGKSIWDTFCEKQNAIVNGDTGLVSTAYYYKFSQDIETMAKLGIKSYRFSISWPRILPLGKGEVNRKGIEFYKTILLTLKKYGIEPYITLYHWDLPQALEDLGGWQNRGIAYDFQNYAELCFKEFGSLCENWFTINEPFCASYLGYHYGIHAPGIRSNLENALKVSHHLNLAHGLAVSSFRKMGCKGRIGVALNPMVPRPATLSKEDLLAADYVCAFKTDIYLDPIFLGKYPEIVLKLYPNAMEIKPGDMEIISQPTDFLGINYYNENAVKWNEEEPAEQTGVEDYHEKTDMDWPIVPMGLVRLLRHVVSFTGSLPIYITENGACYNDVLLEDGRVHDAKRIEYLKLHIQAMKTAIEEGIPVKGYFVWSFIDNFEWSFGYSKRFGIIYCDFNTLKRYPKDSAYFYRDVIANYCDII